MLRAIVDACIMGPLRNRDAMGVAYKTLDYCTQIALPYECKKDKLLESIGIEDRDYWIKFMAERKKQAEAEAKKTKQ